VTVKRCVNQPSNWHQFGCDSWCVVDSEHEYKQQLQQAKAELVKHESQAAESRTLAQQLATIQAEHQRLQYEVRHYHPCCL
jgi:hypothetical protein